MMTLILLIDSDILRSNNLLSITYDNSSNLIGNGNRKVVIITSCGMI